jgi:transposase
LPQPTPNEIRERIIGHKQNKVKEKDIAKWLMISQSTVTKVWAKYQKTNTYQPSPRTQGRKPKINNTILNQITTQIKQNPAITLKKLIEIFDLKISQAALSKHLKKHSNQTTKKRPAPQKDKKTNPNETNHPQTNQ